MLKVWLVGGLWVLRIWPVGDLWILEFVGFGSLGDLRLLDLLEIGSAEALRVLDLLRVASVGPLQKLRIRPVDVLLVKTGPVEGGLQVLEREKISSQSRLPGLSVCCLTPAPASGVAGSDSGLDLRTQDVFPSNTY
jgi:hypothetical protein